MTQLSDRFPSFANKHADTYPQEDLWCVMHQLFKDEQSSPQQVLRVLSHLDANLNFISRMGEFVREANPLGNFPQQN